MRKRNKSLSEIKNYFKYILIPFRLFFELVFFSSNVTDNHVQHIKKLVLSLARAILIRSQRLEK